LIGRAFVCEGHVSYISITPAMIAGDHDADYVTFDYNSINNLLKI
jgi:hypothetical protein